LFDLLLSLTTVISTQRSTRRYTHFFPFTHPRFSSNHLCGSRHLATPARVLILLTTLPGSMHTCTRVHTCARNPGHMLSFKSVAPSKFHGQSLEREKQRERERERERDVIYLIHLVL